MSHDPELANILWMMVCAALVMLMQGGFCFLESGLSRAKNSINVAIKNLVDFCISAAVFWTIGFGLMFGASASGWVGIDRFFPGESSTPWLLAFFLFQLVFCGTATTIISGAVAERMRFRAYMLVSLIVSGLIYPLFGHWAWNGADRGVASGWLGRQGFIDFAGSTVVHSLGGWVALAAILVIGPRLGRFDEKSSRLHGHNLPMATFGVLLLWFGWFGFNGGSTLAVSDSVPLILVNTNLAAAFGGIAGLAVAWLVQRRPDVTHVINGAVAGLVAITASCHIMAPSMAAVIGTVGGVLCSVATYALPKIRIDDVIGAVPAHAIAGAWGTLAVALFADPADFGTGLSRLQQLAVQAKGIAICFGWAFGGGLVCLWMLNRVFRLRVPESHERIGLNVSEHGASTELIDLLGEMRHHREHGDFSKCVTVEPHTEVGQLAGEYNRVLEKVGDEMRRRDQAERKWRGIFENAVEGIFQTTRSGQYIAANPALARIYGYESPEELVKSVRDIATELYVDPSRRAAFRAALADDDILSGFESEVWRKDGSRIWISENARAYRDEQGRLLYYEGTVEDITQRRKTERLQREKEHAEAASRAKSQFLANMSHEIRTPLNGVIGMLDLLSTTEMSESQTRYTELARSSAEMLLSLINDILDFSKIEAGKLELERLDFDLREMLETVPEMFAHRANDKRLELHSYLAPELPERVHGDPERLRQVLVNLMGNAIKFTEEGDVGLSARVVDASDETRPRLRFEIRDTGIGIPSERVDRLFQSFSQVDVSTTRRYGGTGLGLAICKQIVDLMGGQIGVDSVEGQGSTFWIEVSLDVAREEKPGPDHGTELRGMRALVVDDNDTNLQILTEYLTRWGVEADAVHSAHEAIDRLSRAERGEPDYRLAIIDRLMPDMDGLELVGWLRSRSETRQPSVIMLTSLDETLEPSRRDELQMTCLHKPIRQSQLFNALVAVATSEVATPVDGSSRSSFGDKSDTDGGRHVLVVDDNEVNRLVAGEILRSAGYVPDEATNGRDAVRAIRETDYDAVLMDCEMPDMDGFEATRAVRDWENDGARRDGRRTPLPILALTAQAVEGDRQRCLQAGMTEYVTKPIDRQMLLEKLQACLAADTDAGVKTLPAAWGETSPSTDQPPEVQNSIELEQLLDRCTGQDTVAARVLRMFRGRAGDHARRIDEAVSARDLSEVRKASHSLKGSAANVAAVEVSRAAADLEEAAEGGRSEQLTELAGRIFEALDRCDRDIDALVRELDTDGA